jgi:hypothetical protein
VVKTKKKAQSFDQTDLDFLSGVRGKYYIGKEVANISYITVELEELKRTILKSDLDLLNSCFMVMDIAK